MVPIPCVLHARSPRAKAGLKLAFQGVGSGVTRRVRAVVVVVGSLRGVRSLVTRRSPAAANAEATKPAAAVVGLNHLDARGRATSLGPRVEGHQDNHLHSGEENGTENRVRGVCWETYLTCFRVECFALTALPYDHISHVNLDNKYTAYTSHYISCWVQSLHAARRLRVFLALTVYPISTPNIPCVSPCMSWSGSVIQLSLSVRIRRL